MIELLPATVVLGCGAFLIGLDQGVVVPPIGPLLVVAVGLGLWQGWLDRRATEAGFSNHRPVPPIAWQSVRSIAGLTALMALTLLAWAGSWVTLNRYPTAEHLPLSLLRDAYVATFVHSLLAWGALRVAIARPGFLAPVLWAVLVPGAFLAGLHLMRGQTLIKLAPITLAMLCLLYQPVRLSGASR
ncbi:MAG: hypothetical protein AAGD14_03220 [Planctomycetota bacterium]